MFATPTHRYDPDGGIHSEARLCEMVIDRYIESLFGSRRWPPAPSSLHEAFLEKALDRFLETLEIRRDWWLERQAASPQGTNGWIWFQGHIEFAQPSRHDPRPTRPTRTRAAVGMGRCRGRARSARTSRSSDRRVYDNRVLGVVRVGQLRAGHVPCYERAGAAPCRTGTGSRRVSSEHRQGERNDLALRRRG